MITTDIKINEIPYLYDQSGRILVKGDDIYRIIEDKSHINNYKELLNSPDIEELFLSGLVRTEIIDEESSNDVMILKHKKIPFILHPCEYSNKMFWQAACMFIELNLELWKRGFVTHDSHPWNISFEGSKPVFYDFGSIIKRTNITQEWFDQFFTYFIVPIWLASFSPKTYNFSKEYRREHDSGFGVKFFNSSKIKKLLFRRVRGIAKFKNNPEKLLSELLIWLHKHKPIVVKGEYWSGYYQSKVNGYDNPTSIKQRFVYDVLLKEKPATIADLASNKGYYAFMAANLGADVVAFDYEEEIVNFLLLESTFKTKVTPVHMDFNKPTAAFGVGFYWGDSYQRFNSEIVLALGLIHHICITQNIPVYLFCEACKKFATKGIILEFVAPTDKHVASWNKKAPKDYNIEKIIFFMKDKFPNFEVSNSINEDGLNRTILYFYN